MKKPTISVLIVTYNSGDFISDCLESVLKNQNSKFDLDVIISDNNSKDSTVSLIKKKFPSVRIIENKTNLGFAGGVNIAIKFAIKSKSDYMFILNPDTVLNKNTLLQLFIHRNLGDILSPKIYFADRPKTLWYAGGRVDWENCYGNHIGVDQIDNSQFDNNSEIEFATGCAELIKREVFEKIGLMNDRYFLYLEDIDFSLRAAKNGFKIVFIPSSFLYHLNAKSTKMGSPLQDYFITRNRLYFALKFASLRTKVAVFKQSIGFLFTGRLAQKLAVKDFLMFKMGKGTIFSHI